MNGDEDLGLPMTLGGKKVQIAQKNWKIICI
jgi:hypothetical protein